MNQALCEGCVPCTRHSHLVPVPGSLEASGSQGVCCASQILRALQRPMEGRFPVADFQNGLQRRSYRMLNA